MRLGLHSSKGCYVEICGKQVYRCCMLGVCLMPLINWSHLFWLSLLSQLSQPLWVVQRYILIWPLRSFGFIIWAIRRAAVKANDCIIHNICHVKKLIYKSIHNFQKVPSSLIRKHSFLYRSNNIAPINSIWFPSSNKRESCLILSCKDWNIVGWGLR